MKTIDALRAMIAEMEVSRINHERRAKETTNDGDKYWVQEYGLRIEALKQAITALQERVK